MLRSYNYESIALGDPRFLAVSLLRCLNLLMHQSYYQRATNGKANTTRLPRPSTSTRERPTAELTRRVFYLPWPEVISRFELRCSSFVADEHLHDLRSQLAAIALHTGGRAVAGVYWIGTVTGYDVYLTDSATDPFNPEFSYVLAELRSEYVQEGRRTNYETLFSVGSRFENSLVTYSSYSTQFRKENIVH